MKSRIQICELIVIPTDKSGNFAVMTRESYAKAGLEHAKKDLSVGWNEIKEAQKEINGHVSMPIKFSRLEILGTSKKG